MPWSGPSPARSLSWASPPAARSPSSSPSTIPTWSVGWCWSPPPAGWPPAGRRMQRDLARYTLAGRPRRAWAATGPELAATTAGGHLYAALLLLFGPRLTPKDPSDMLIVIDAEDRFDAAPQLHRITAPTLVVAGDRDRNYTPELFRETADRIPGARLRLYRGKGHASIATLRYRPAVREILGFLTADDAGP